MQPSNSCLSIDQILALRPTLALEPPQWSPDSREIAFVSTMNGGPELWSCSAQGGYPTRMTVGMGGVRFLGTNNARRSPDGKWIAYISEKSGAAELWLHPESGDADIQLTHLGANINALSWAPDSSAIAFSGNRYGSFDIYRVQIADGNTCRLTQRPEYDVYPVFTPDGEQIVYVQLNDAWTDHTIVAIPAGEGPARVVAQDTNLFDYHYGKTFGYPLVSPDGQTVLFRSHRNGFLNYWRVPLHGGDARPLCAESADQSEACWSPTGDAVAYISNDKGTLNLCIADAKSGHVRKLVAPAMGACAQPQWSPNGEQIAYLYQSPTSTIDLWVVDVSNGQQRQISQSMMGESVSSRLVTPQKVSYRSFDGRDIHAYLYAPAVPAVGQKPAGILWIHGGPTNQWFDAFYPNVQYFVQRGYVILLPNIRGSSGYGREFEDLNNGDWGYGDLKDAVAGADFLKANANVHPDKLAITGTSYGGCLSMSAVCFAPGAFQASIPASGYADWPAMYQEQELRHNQLLRYEFGPFETSQDVYRRCSPIYSVKQATTPTFVIHGEGGLPRSSASLDFVKALEKEYKTVHYKAYPNEGYYVLSLANMRQMWLDMCDFLERYL